MSRDRLYVRERPLLTLLACVAGVALVAVACGGLGYWLGGVWP